MKEKLNTLITVLKNTPLIISNYIQQIPENDLPIKKGADFWTIKKHLLHLEYVQNILHERILKFKNDQFPKITPYFPENDEIVENKFNNINEIIDSYKSKRNKQIKLIDVLDEKDFLKEAVHNEYKKYNIEIILNHIIFHDYWHMYRIEELWLTKDEYLSK